MALKDVLSIPLGYHLIFGFCIRLLLILYADYHDSVYNLKYTDIEYKVFTDAARYVWNGESPFKRYTYRYSPVIAWMLVPNVVINENFGKVLFSVFDILIALGTKYFVQRQLKGEAYAERVANYCSMFWLYCGWSIAITTRGSADSVTCFAILLSLNFLQCCTVRNDFNFVLSGLFLAIAIHLRLYPIIFSFPMYLSLGNYKINRNTTFRESLTSFIPNRKQIIFMVSTIVYLAIITYSMYLMYGYEFILETYVYYYFRKDVRYNFSLYAYTSYLTISDDVIDITKFTALVFMFIVMLAVSLAYGCNSQTLPFALFCQAAILVTYNSVVTSHHFVWYLSLLPLIVHDSTVFWRDGIGMLLIWFLGMSLWLQAAYHLEYEGEEVFLGLAIGCSCTFIVNMLVLSDLIKYYKPGHAFGLSNTNAQPQNK